MITIEDMDYFTRVSDVIANRASVINQVLGSGSVFYADNPCRIMHVKGDYSFVLCGCEVARWRIWDVGGIEHALSLVDACNDTVWFLARGGFVKVPTNN